MSSSGLGSSSSSLSSQCESASAGERTVRTHGVVIDPPGFDQDLRLGNTAEPGFIQAFVAELPVEAFHGRVLDRFAWRDESQRHLVGVGPGVKRSAAEFRSVVPCSKELKTGQLLLWKGFTSTRRSCRLATEDLHSTRSGSGGAGSTDSLIHCESDLHEPLQASCGMHRFHGTSRSQDMSGKGIPSSISGSVWSLSRGSSVPSLVRTTGISMIRSLGFRKHRSFPRRRRRCLGGRWAHLILSVALSTWV